MPVAVFNERRMRRHRQPGVTYSQATFRRDGGWRRTDALLWVVALLAGVAIALSGA